jgi:hypothetical protein
VSCYVSISQAAAPNHLLHHLQQDMSSSLLSHSFNRDLSQLDKDFLSRNIK